MQTDTGPPNNKRELKKRKQRQGRRRLKKRLYIQRTNLARIYIHSVCLLLTEIFQQNTHDSAKFEKEILKISRRISRSLEFAARGHSMMPFCQEWQRNEQKIITHAYIAITLFALPLWFAHF